jgi:hypothetical protein
MAADTDKTEELSQSSLDLSSAPRSDVALLRCVDTSVLRGPAGREIKLSTGEVTIGRGKENSVPVDGTGMSRVHARLYFSDDAWHVEDLGSTNGTRVNNSNVTRASLSDGDTLAFGRVCYKFLKLDATVAPRKLDLGLDQTLVLSPGELPGGASGDHTDTVRTRAQETLRRTRPAAPASSSGLGTWLAVAAIALVAVVGALLLVV